MTNMRTRPSLPGSSRGGPSVARSSPGGSSVARSSRGASSRRLLRAGDLVEVRPPAEILATLDADGKVDGMPFMPEMLRFAGRRFRVYKRADKTCDTTHSTGLRRLHNTVHLTDLRCDGAAHGGCQAGCLLYWNERWLRRVGSPTGAAQEPGAAEVAPDAVGRGVTPDEVISAGEVATAIPAGLAPPEAAGPERITEARLAELAHRPPAEDGSDRWMCQATEVFSASSPLPWWDPAQYVRDLRTRNASMRQVLVGIARWLSVRVQWRINRSGVPFVKGRLATTPAVRLDLQPGERVRIKSRKQIEETLDTANRNRGLRVDADMMLFCNQERRVLRRVSRIIDERTGALITIPGDCIVLDGVTCTGAYNRACPRSDYPYWREIWLSRIDPAPLPAVAEGAASPSDAEVGAPR